jgi:hypothetical protein
MASNIFTDRECIEKWIGERALSHLSSRLQHWDPGSDDHNASDSLVLYSIVYGPSSVDSPQSSCLVHEETLRKLRATDHFPPRKAASSSSPDLPLFKIGPVQGRTNDCGIFATRTITVGEVILVENPAIISPIVLPLSRLVLEKQRIYTSLFERLPDRLCSEILELKSVKEKECSRQESIIRTNGIAIELGDMYYSGIFPNMSRCNHRYELHPSSYC